MKKDREILAEKVAFRYFTMICWGLYHIHKNGWIHRDIKPDNIFVKKLGGD
jgi:serine/threonine protein kinase